MNITRVRTIAVVLLFCLLPGPATAAAAPPVVVLHGDGAGPEGQVVRFTLVMAEETNRRPAITGTLQIGTGPARAVFIPDHQGATIAHADLDGDGVAGLSRLTFEAQAQGANPTGEGSTGLWQINVEPSASDIDASGRYDLVIGLTNQETTLRFPVVADIRVSH